MANVNVEKWEGGREKWSSGGTPRERGVVLASVKEMGHETLLKWLGASND